MADHTASDDARDRQWLEAVRKSDADACRSLYLTHAPALFRFAYAMARARDVAEDVVQDVFVALWERRATLQIQGSVRGYLFGAVRNRVLKIRRHDRVVTNAQETQADAMTLPVAEGADHVLERMERMRRVRHILAQLPEREQLALTLRLAHQMSFADIGTALGITGEGARLAVLKAHERLAQHFLPDDL